MSVHGICYDNGMSGKCNILCEQFQAGECECAEDVLLAAIDSEEFDDEDLIEIINIYF